MKELSFLHFSDLHCGQKGHDHYWPTYKVQLREDIKWLGEKIGRPWDLVLFTGDLAFSGGQSEYQQLTEILEEVWDWFKAMGSTPYFLSVPGNHDLTRLSDAHPIPIALNSYEKKPQIKKEFWEEQNSIYRTTVNQAFSSYTDWLSTLSVPIPDKISWGILPGDFSASLCLNGFNLGVVGLNSSFFQLTDGDFTGKLCLSAKQIHPLVNNSPDDWCNKHSFNILMTHHCPSWLSVSSLEEYRGEINTPNRFNLHLFGHLHDSNISDISEGGGSPKKLRQGSSLLGLEKYGSSKAKRKQGYFAFKISISEDDGIERLWPRELVTRAGGHHSFDYDLRFERNEEDTVFIPFKAKKNAEEAEDPESQEGMIPEVPEVPELTSDKPTLSPDKALVNSLSEELANSHQENEKRLPRFILKLLPQHKAIRQAEQASLEKALLEERCAILVSDWGLGRLEFLATVINRLEQAGSIDFFRVSCDCIDQLSHLDAIFQQQLGFPFRETMDLMASLEKPVLFLDNLAPSILDPKIEGLNCIDRFIQPLLDFCPSILLILGTRQIENAFHFPTIELKPLEIPETRLYLQKHNLVGEELLEPSAIEAIHLKSDGLPMHIERLIEDLQVSSLYEVLTSDDEMSPVDRAKEPIPIALQKAVAELSTSEDRFKRRSFKLLQILSFLPYGENISDLKRFFPTQPIFPQNAVDLLNLDLVAIETPLEFSKRESSVDLFKAGITGEEKRLVVPRQVRDYVSYLTSPQELEDLSKAALFFLFGDNWLSGSAHLKPCRRRTLRNSQKIGPGNEHAVVATNLRMAIQAGAQEHIRRAIQLAINLTSVLIEASRYRDSTTVAGEYFAIASGFLTEEENKQFSILHAKGLRMTGKRHEALQKLDQVIQDHSNLLSKNEIGEVELLRALIFENLNEREEAILAAKTVIDLSKKDSGRYNQALGILAGYIEDQKERISRLSEIEREARKSESYVAANNIALDLYRELDGEQAKLEVLQRVIECPDDAYNVVRALLKKGEIANKIGSKVSLSNAEKAMLMQAYSFLFSQRLGVLFDSCHCVLWNELIKESNLSDQLVMFRMSSFIWRLQGEDEKEREYVSQINPSLIENLGVSAKKGIVMALNYFRKRVVLIINEKNE